MSNRATALDAQNKNAQETNDSLDDIKKDNQSFFSALFNTLDNKFTQIMDWPMTDQLTGILKVTTYIAELLTMQELGELGSGIKNLVGKLGGKLAGTKLGSAIGGKIASLSIGNATGTAALGGVAGIAAGGIMGVHDAIAMQGSESTMIGSTARGFFLGTGSTQKNRGENALSTAGNAVKWGAIGAGIGTFIAPGVGTVIGGAIGGISGLLLGMWGTSRENKKLQEEQLEKQKEIEINTAKTTDKVGLLTTYKNSSVTAAGGDTYGYGTGKLYTHTPKPKVGGYNITSWYGDRGKVKNSKGDVVATGFHSGIDIGTGKGKPVGAPYDGHVVYNDWWTGGGNTFGLMDLNGYVHTFMHLQNKPNYSYGDKLKAGQFVGLTGGTGGNYDPHLHYSVSVGTYSKKNTIDPFDFLVNSSIFNVSGNSSFIPESQSGESTDLVSSALESSTKDSVTLRSLAVGGDSSPVVDSIHNLRDTIVGLTDQEKAQKQIMSLLTNARTSPTY